MNNIAAFENGDSILEPDINNSILPFTSEKELYYHAIKHIFVFRTKEKWENMGFIDRNTFARLLKNDKIAGFLSAVNSFLSDSFSETCNNQRSKKDKWGKNRKRDSEAAKQEEDENALIKSESFCTELKDFINNAFGVCFKNCPDAIDICRKYHKFVSKLLLEGCNGSVPHIHLLKIENKNNICRKRQVIKLFHPQLAIMVIARVNYDDNNFAEHFCISSSYRCLVHINQSERLESFYRYEKHIKDIEQLHDRKYHLKGCLIHNMTEQLNEDKTQESSIQES